MARWGFPNASFISLLFDNGKMDWEVVKGFIFLIFVFLFVYCFAGYPDGLGKGGGFFLHSNFRILEFGSSRASVCMFFLLQVHDVCVRQCFFLFHKPFYFLPPFHAFPASSLPPSLHLCLSLYLTLSFLLEACHGKFEIFDAMLVTAWEGRIFWKCRHL